MCWVKSHKELNGRNLIRPLGTAAKNFSVLRLDKLGIELLEQTLHGKVNLK